MMNIFDGPLTSAYINIFIIKKVCYFSNKVKKYINNNDFAINNKDTLSHDIYTAFIDISVWQTNTE